jgi:hypothetical protein
MIAPIKIWTDDHTQLVQDLMDQMLLPCNNIVRQVITAAYMAGYEPYSDGITLMPRLEFQGFQMKNPMGVGHDWLYYMGPKSPFLPSGCVGDWQQQKWCDEWFDLAMKAFGHPILAPVFWFGLRCGGWRAWQLHRQAGDPQTRLTDIKENAT